MILHDYLKPLNSNMPPYGYEIYTSPNMVRKISFNDDRYRLLILRFLSDNFWSALFNVDLVHEVRKIYIYHID